MGTVWGVAFNKQAQTYYMTSFANRHSGEGPLGYGGIYILQSNGGGAYTKATGVNLQGVTTSNGTVLDFGTITRNQISNDDNEIADGANTPSRDLDAYAKVGNMSYGDTDFYEKEQKLFAVNMFQQSLLEIDATGISGLSGAALGAKVKSYQISNLANAPSCTGGLLKSWGLKIYKDVGYLGIVCNAATSQVREDLKGFVMSFDPKNVAAGLTKVLDVNLNYRNGNEDWKPWSSTWAQTNIPIVADVSTTYSEPAISDIEFDENGAMILGLMNIQGHKLGHYNYYPVSGNQDLLRGIAHGDILLACYDPATKKWNLENTVAGCGPNYTLQNNFDNGYIATGRGPALGEFFDDAS
ncbi:MAG: hypothetical protein NWP83_04310, partial [Spirosomaceae bacterium]|nr:hypothetical protein [Spirosomataceae bacterium]